MIRLFTAIALPGSVIDQLQALGGGVRGARWVDSEQTHLTLRFIGEVDNALFDDIRLELGRVRAPTFALALTGVDAFANRHRARTLWAGVTPCPELMRLQAKIEAGLQRAGLEPERRKFSPHVTLARLSSAPRERVHAFLSQHGLFRTEMFPVHSFILYSSHLSRSGAIHQAEVEYPLMDSPDAGSEKTAETASYQP